MDPALNGSAAAWAPDVQWAETFFSPLTPRNSISNHTRGSGNQRSAAAVYLGRLFLLPNLTLQCSANRPPFWQTWFREHLSTGKNLEKKNNQKRCIHTQFNTFLLRTHNSRLHIIRRQLFCKSPHHQEQRHNTAALRLCQHSQICVYTLYLEERKLKENHWCHMGWMNIYI